MKRKARLGAQAGSRVVDRSLLENQVESKLMSAVSMHMCLKYLYCGILVSCNNTMGRFSKQ